MGKKIKVIKEEYNNDGEIQFDVHLCGSQQLLDTKFQELKDYYKSLPQFKNNDEYYGENSIKIEESEDSFYMYNECDDYYILLEIIEKEIL